MSASVASAVAGATTFSTSPAAKSVWLDEKVAVVPDRGDGRGQELRAVLLDREHADEPVAAVPAFR